jgi:hypothetical protein
MNFSSFANSDLRMLSAGFPVSPSRDTGIFFSSSSSRFTPAPFDFSGLSFCATDSCDPETFFINSGLIVSRSQPASSRISPPLRKLPPSRNIEAGQCARLCPRRHQCSHRDLRSSVSINAGAVFLFVRYFLVHDDFVIGVPKNIVG